MALVDVVVVSYLSRDRLRACVCPLAGAPDLRVVVVDNASTDGSLDSVADLPVVRIARPANGGFAVGCNEGWRSGDAPFVLFLNPDAQIEPAAIATLVDVLRRDRSVGATGPLIRAEDASLSPSQRRFPRLVHLAAWAAFLHRPFAGTSWADDVVRGTSAYARPCSPDWLSGACLLVRRTALEALGGFDERFFLYAEDVDLCLRLRRLGYDIRFEPAATARHAGGASASRDATLPLLAHSQAAYARKHLGRVRGGLFRLLLAAGFAGRALAVPRRRRAYARAACASLGPNSRTTRAGAPSASA